MASADTSAACTRAVLTPDELIDRFCSEIGVGGHGPLGTTPAVSGVRISKGFCGFDGSSGYDGGYEFLADLLGRGWEPLHLKGEWPYLVYLKWRPKAEHDKPAIAAYCEGDLTVWVFDSAEIAKRHYAELPDTE